MVGIRTDINAARVSAAGDGWTEPLYDFVESLILCQESTNHIRGWCFFAGWDSNFS